MNEPHDDWELSEVRVRPRPTRAQAEYRAFMAMLKPRKQAPTQADMLRRLQNSAPLMGQRGSYANRTDAFSGLADPYGQMRPLDSGIAKILGLW